MSLFGFLDYARSEIIDLYFIVTDLIDIERSSEEISRDGEFDRHCEEMADKKTPKRSIPLGKLVK